MLNSGCREVIDRLWKILSCFSFHGEAKLFQVDLWRAKISLILLLKFEVSKKNVSFAALLHFTTLCRLCYLDSTIKTKIFFFLDNHFLRIFATQSTC